jgi:hypothetical protein
MGRARAMIFDPKLDSTRKNQTQSQKIWANLTRPTGKHGPTQLDPMFEQVYLKLIPRSRYKKFNGDKFIFLLSLSFSIWSPTENEIIL